MGGSEVVSLTSSEGSIAPPTLARRNASEVRDAHDPGRTGKDQRLAAVGAAARVEVGARQEDDREDSVDDVQQPFPGTAAADEGRQAEQALERGQAGHDQVARPKTAAQLLGAEVEIRSTPCHPHPVNKKNHCSAPTT